MGIFPTVVAWWRWQRLFVHVYFLHPGCGPSCVIAQALIPPAFEESF